MKVLLLALLCVAAVAAYTEEDLEYALYEDAGILVRIRDRIRQGFEKIVDKIKDLIEKHKPLVQGFKDRLEDVKEQIKNLLSKTGEKFGQAVSSIRARISQLLKDVLGKIGKGGDEDTTSYALYADDDESSPFEQLAQRIRAHAQAALQRLRDFISKHAELATTQVKAKIEELKNKLAELATVHGKPLLEKAKQVGASIVQFFKDLLNKIFNKGNAALYSVEEESESFLQSLKNRVIARLQDALANIKEKLSHVQSEIVAQVLPKIQEVREKIGELAQKTGEKLLEAAGKITQKIREILAQLAGKILGGSTYYMDIAEAARTLRDFFISDQGIAALKENANAAQPSTSTGLLIKTYILAASKEALKELIQELFKGVYYAAPYSDIKDLVIAASKWLQTDEGITTVRRYASNLQTSHPVVLRLKVMLETASDDEVRSLFRDIFTIQ